MLIGYMRVSKADGSQILDLQRDALLAAGVNAAHVYEDLASGRRDARHGLTACLKALREGDKLLVWKLDRLGRNLRHLVNTVHDLPYLVGIPQNEISEIARLFNRCSDITDAHDASQAKHSSVPSSAELQQDIAATRALIDQIKKRKKSNSHSPSTQ